MRGLMLLLAVVAALAATPARAQRQSLADRVASLEQQAATQTSSSGQANVELLNRLTQLQAEVQALRNQVEQLQNDNEQIKQHDRQQYTDLDARLQTLEGGTDTAPAAPPLAAGPAPRVMPPASGAPRPASGGTRSTPTASMPAASAGADEQAVYGTAFDALKQGDYVASARGFQAYLAAYPQGSLAPNAWYWLGESYYVTQNYPTALQSFQMLLSQFPRSSKVSDATLKKGYCQLELGQTGPGQQTLNQVIHDYPGSDAARLASSRLRALNLDTH